MENKILTFARSLPEHRMDRKKLHLAEDIVYITLAAVICGTGNWEDISDFGKAKEDFLRDTLSLKNGISSPDTFNRFFAGLSPYVFEANLYRLGEMSLQQKLKDSCYRRKNSQGVPQRREQVCDPHGKHVCCC